LINLWEVGDMITSVKNKFIFIYTYETGWASIQNFFNLQVG